MNPPQYKDSSRLKPADDDNDGSSGNNNEVIYDIEAAEKYISSNAVNKGPVFNKQLPRTITSKEQEIKISDILGGEFSVDELEINPDSARDENNPLLSTVSRVQPAVDWNRDRVPRQQVSVSVTSVTVSVTSSVDYFILYYNIMYYTHHLHHYHYHYRKLSNRLDMIWSIMMIRLMQLKVVVVLVVVVAININILNISR